jgi:hypothetical protein
VVDTFDWSRGTPAIPPWAALFAIGYLKGLREAVYAE